MPVDTEKGEGMRYTYRRVDIMRKGAKYFCTDKIIPHDITGSEREENNFINKKF